MIMQHQNNILKISWNLPLQNIKMIILEQKEKKWLIWCNFYIFLLKWEKCFTSNLVEFNNISISVALVERKRLIHIWDVIRFHFSRSRCVPDLQFWPVIDIGKVRWCAKFLIGHLFDWYFTDWFKNYLYCWIFNELEGEILWNFPCTQPLLKKIHRYISKIQMTVVL